MRDYQPHDKDFGLPSGIYHQSIWAVRDYFRLESTTKAMMTEQPVSDGQPKPRGGVSDPVSRIAIRREQNLKRMHAVEDALATIPAEYRRGVWQNVTQQELDKQGNPIPHGDGYRKYIGYPNDADRRTYSRYKSKFLYNVARNLDLI